MPDIETWDKAFTPNVSGRSRGQSVMSDFLFHMSAKNKNKNRNRMTLPSGSGNPNNMYTNHIITTVLKFSDTEYITVKYCVLMFLCAVEKFTTQHRHCDIFNDSLKCLFSSRWSFSSWVCSVCVCDISPPCASLIVKWQPGNHQLFTVKQFLSSPALIQRLYLEHLTAMTRDSLKVTMELLLLIFDN